MYRAGCFDPAKTKGIDILKLNMLTTDIMLNEDDHPTVAGVQYYVDMKGGSMEHYTIYGPTMGGKMFMLVQHAYPMRIKGLNYVNAPSYFDIVYNIFKFALTEKLKKRVS